MSEMVERVAKALFQWQHGHDRWDEAEPDVREDACEAARAAIEAMREPTEAMCDAADALDRVEAGVLRTEVPFDAWIAMIDEALKGDAA